MHLIKYNPSHLSYNLWPIIKHTPQNLCGHNNTTCTLIHSNITSHQTNIMKLLLQFPVLLITQSLNRTSINNPLLIIQTLSNSVLSNSSFTSWSMSSHQDRLILHNTFNCFILKCVQGKLVFLGQFLRPYKLLSALPVFRGYEFMNAIGLVDPLVDVVLFIVTHF